MTQTRSLIMGMALAIIVIVSAGALTYNKGYYLSHRDYILNGGRVDPLVGFIFEAQGIIEDFGFEGGEILLHDDSAITFGDDDDATMEYDEDGTDTLLITATTSHVGNMTVTGMVRQTATWHAYGGFQDEAEALSLAADTWTHVTNVGNDLWTGLEADGLTLVDDEMIVTNAGDYIGNMSITITGGNSKDFLFRVYNVTQAAVMGYHIGASTTVSNYTNINLPLYLECDAGDVLQVQAWCLAGDDPTLRSSIFYINYLHD